ncbi:ATP-binding protein [Streptomycetaceae bacterium NBC_01309]
MSTPTHHLSATARSFVQPLSSTPRGARLGRLLAGEQLRAWAVPRDQAERAEHVVAELAANAALHGHHSQRDFRLALMFHPMSGVLRVEVTDTRGVHALPEHPSPPHPDHESGRGLLLVDALADRWGTDPHPPTGKTVWAELLHRRDAT